MDLKDTVAGPYFFNGPKNCFTKFYENNLHQYWGYATSRYMVIRFTIQSDGLLSFDLLPDSPKDIFNFGLYQAIPPVDLWMRGFEKLGWDALQNQKPLRQFWCGKNENKGICGLADTATFTILGDVSSNKLKSYYLKSLPVKKGETYILVVSDTPLWKNPAPLSPFKVVFHNKVEKYSAPIILKNVNFETSKSILLVTSYPELDKLVARLKLNSKMKIEISGHTDNSGNEPSNQKLSETRAKTVMDYLISKGIDKSRLSYKGFGSKTPIADNKTDEGKQKNRRVEFTILSE